MKCGYWTPARPQKLCGNCTRGRDQEPAEEFTAGRWLSTAFLKGSCFSAITRSYFNVLCHFRLFTFALYRGAAGDYLTANKLDCYAGACALLFAQSAKIPKNYMQDEENGLLESKETMQVTRLLMLLYYILSPSPLISENKKADRKLNKRLELQSNFFLFIVFLASYSLTYA